MGVDIKIPIGLMFTILGVILSVYGLVTNGDPMYARSLGININLWSGLCMLVFGGIMLVLSWLPKKNRKA
ncbi:MAG: hypothetical protein U0T82_09610 [Bacteroidales bacterium]